MDETWIIDGALEWCGKRNANPTHDLIFWSSVVTVVLDDIYWYLLPNKIPNLHKFTYGPKFTYVEPRIGQIQFEDHFPDLILKGSIWNLGGVGWLFFCDAALLPPTAGHVELWPRWSDGTNAPCGGERHDYWRQPWFFLGVCYRGVIYHIQYSMNITGWWFQTFFIFPFHIWDVILLID